MKNAIAIPKDCIKQTDQLILIDVTRIPGQPYEKLAIYRNHGVNIYDIEEQIEDDFTGCILIDKLLYSANTAHRFGECHVEDGGIVPGSISIREYSPHPDIYDLSDHVARQDPNLKALLLI